MAQTQQPDWDKIAEKFDMWLPQIAPVGQAMIEVLDAAPGQRILDMASGTGEPALTLAQQLGDQAEIIGTDAAEGMVRVSQGKVDALGLKHLSFRTMPAEKLDFEDNSFDRVLCRFGVMLFEDSLKGAQEMCRVLKPGGKFAIAVWHTPETMPTMHWSYQVFKPRLSEENLPALAKVTSLGGPGVLEDLLYKAGFTDFTIETKTLYYQFDSFDAYWGQMEASDILKQQFDALPKEEHAKIRDEVAQFASEFIKDGSLSVPHEYLLAWGSK